MKKKMMFLFLGFALVGCSSDYENGSLEGANSKSTSLEAGSLENDAAYETPEDEEAHAEPDTTEEDDTYEEYISGWVEAEQLVSTEMLYDEFAIGSTGDTAQITLESYDGGSQILKVVCDDETLGEVYMHTSHGGNKDVYLSYLDGDTCLFVYTPYTMQGDVSLSYEVLSYYSGEEQVVDSDVIDFRYSLYEEADIPIDDVCAFADTVSGYLEGAKLLVSVSIDGVTTTEEYSGGYAEFTKVLPIVCEELYERLGLDDLELLEEKLEMINKYYKETYEQHGIND